MFFILSKMLAILLEPLAHPYILLLLAGLMRLLRRRRMMRLCIGMAVVLPLLYAVLPLSTLPLRMLEDSYEVPKVTQQVDGILVLGGHTDNGWVSETRGQAQQNRASDRLTKAIMLHRQQPQAMLIFTGFSGRLSPRGWNEAEITRRLLDELGVSENDVLFEVTSRNTWENAVNSLKVAVPQPGSRWILVTSASHMPRAVAAFTAAGWEGLIPYPTDFQTPTHGPEAFDLAVGTAAVRNWLHEYVGIAAYRITGRASAVSDAQR